jgi:hypothetical protein
MNVRQRLTFNFVDSPNSICKMFHSIAIKQRFTDEGETFRLTFNQNQMITLEDETLSSIISPNCQVL